MKQIKGFEQARQNIVTRYLKAKETIISLGFGPEITWQDSLQFGQITESDLLREAAWVVLSSGMREAVIRLKFPKISEAFYLWRSAKLIVRNSTKCRERGFTVYRHRAKINAIITIAERINHLGVDVFKQRVLNEGVKFIQTLPFMGQATSYHLAKNIGLDAVKPDRHLLRVAATAGYGNPVLLCKEISESVGDRIGVVDLVIWRFATLQPNYIEWFSLKRKRLKGSA